MRSVTTARPRLCRAMANGCWAAALLGLVVSAVRCSAGDPPGEAEKTGTVALRLTLPAGVVINQINYAISGPNTYSGTANVKGAPVLQVGVNQIAPGSGYVLSENATTVDGTIACAGASAPFTVSSGQTTAVSLALSCTKAAAAGSVLGTAVGTDCAQWTSAFAAPNETTVGDSVQISAAATAPNAAALTYTWTALAGSIDTPNQATANFTCPSTPGQVTITLTVGDGPLPPGGSCPASDTTTSLVVTCDPQASADSGVAACMPDATTCNSCLAPAVDFLNQCAPQTAGCIPFTDTVPTHPTL
jgi:hypothetical protein